MIHMITYHDFLGVQRVCARWVDIAMEGNDQGSFFWLEYAAGDQWLEVASFCVLCSLRHQGSQLVPEKHEKQLIVYEPVVKTQCK